MPFRNVAVSLFALFATLGLARSQDQVLNANGPRTNPLFITQKGIVVMEAESVPVDFPWLFKTSPVDDYTGAGYLRFDGNDPRGGAPLGTMSYYFEIQAPGTYRLVLRSRKIDQVEGHLGNDCYAKLVGHKGYQGNNTKVFVSGPNNAWITSTQFDVDHTSYTPLYTLEEAGIYELEISGRSQDFFLDRIVLFDTALATFEQATKTTLRESPRRAFGQSGQVSEIEKFVLTTTGNTTRVIQTLEQNDVIDLAVVGNGLSILAEVDGFVTEVEFSYEGALWTEGGAPYAMAGNQGDEMNPVAYLATPGSKTVRASAYVEGFLQDTVQLSFTVINTGPTLAPTTTAPTTVGPTASPSLAPTTLAPSNAPTTSMPTQTPTMSPSNAPTTLSPTAFPTEKPTTATPTGTPTISPAPTLAPTGVLQLTREADSQGTKGSFGWSMVIGLLVAFVGAAL